MGVGVKVIYLTTDDPLYLPAFFERVFDKCGTLTRAVYIVPPLYKGQTPLLAVWQYYYTFGMEGVIGLAPRVLQAKVRQQSIATVCKKRNIPCALIQDVNTPSFLERLRSMAPDLIVSVSCPQIFNKPLIDLPPLGCLNIHGAILPDYRGVLPSFWMLTHGEEKAGVSIYYVNEKIDAGDLCGQRVFNIKPEESLHEFIKRSKSFAADLLIEVINKIKNGTITRTPLDLSKGSYYSWPDKNAVRRFRASGRRLW